MNLLDELAVEIRETPSFSETARAVRVSLRRELSHHHWVGVYMAAAENTYDYFR